MRILAIDTAAERCAACVYDVQAGRELGRESLDIGKGHAEALMGVIAAALGNARLTYADLDALAVSVGPGSFTGVRIGVATARGLSLALGIPAAGVTTLAAIAHEAHRTFSGRPVLSVLDAKRAEIHAALHGADGEEIVAPFATDAAGAAALARRHDAVLAGSGAGPVAALAGTPLDIAGQDATADIAAFAACAARAGFSGARPKPIYLRGPDARPQDGFALPRRAS